MCVKVVPFGSELIGASYGSVHFIPSLTVAWVFPDKGLLPPDQLGGITISIGFLPWTVGLRFEFSKKAKAN